SRGHGLRDPLPVALGDCRAEPVVPEPGALRLLTGPGALSTRPRPLTSLKAVVYSALPGAGGARGRNCSPAVIANGVTYRQCGASGGADAGGGRRPTPRGPSRGVRAGPAGPPRLRPFRGWGGGPPAPPRSPGGPAGWGSPPGRRPGPRRRWPSGRGTGPTASRGPPGPPLPAARRRERH